MTQEEIMQYLDKNPNKMFTCKEIYSVFKSKLIKRNVYRALKYIIKREEYHVRIERVNGRLLNFYGRK